MLLLEDDEALVNPLSLAPWDVVERKLVDCARPHRLLAPLLKLSKLDEQLLLQVADAFGWGLVKLCLTTT